MIKVLVVDDSAIVRKLLSAELSRYPDIDVVGSAIDPYVAREKIAQLSPDVLVLDVEMPRMDGLTFLDKLMKHHPLPTVILSSVTPEKSEAALRALELGAVEVVSKPGGAYTVPDVSKRLVHAIRTAAVARVQRTVTNGATPPTRHINVVSTTNKIVAIGASTGGTKAIEVVLRAMPSNCPPIVIVQHMPAHFTGPFADRLNRVCGIEVREAREGDGLARGCALVAPGNKHMLLKASGATYSVALKDGPPVHHQRPAVDVLFHSVATLAGKNAVGVILTGMGADGAVGLLAMQQAGAYTVAEDESTCIVFGMPKEAIALGAAREVLPLDKIATAIIAAAETSYRK
jgi:two-component system, chemotaxis family, protein-glutamate methylesterase/glutaminase